MKKKQRKQTQRSLERNLPNPLDRPKPQFGAKGSAWAGIINPRNLVKLTHDPVAMDLATAAFNKAKQLLKAQRSSNGQ